MERILVVFLRMQAKVCDRTGQPVVDRTLAKTSDEWFSRIHSILLQVSVKTTHSWTTTSRRKELCTWCCDCVVKCSWRVKPSCWTLRRPTPMTTWKPRSRESTRSTTWTRERARSCYSLRGQFCVVIGPRCSSVCLIPSHGHRHACMSRAFSMITLTFSSSSPSSSHSSLSSSSSFYPSTSPRLSSKSPVHSRQGDGVYWQVLLQHTSSNPYCGQCQNQRQGLHAPHFHRPVGSRPSEQFLRIPVRYVRFVWSFSVASAYGVFLHSFQQQTPSRSQPSKRTFSIRYWQLRSTRIIVAGFWFHGIGSCSLFVAVADSEAHFCEARDFFGIDKINGFAHRMQATRLLGVWQQARTRNDTQQQIDICWRCLLPQMVTKLPWTRCQLSRTLNISRRWSKTDSFGQNPCRRGDASQEQHERNIASRCHVFDG